MVKYCISWKFNDLHILFLIRFRPGVSNRHRTRKINNNVITSVKCHLHVLNIWIVDILKKNALILYSVMLNTFVSNFLWFLFTSIYMIILHQNVRTSCNYKAHQKFTCIFIWINKWMGVYMVYVWIFHCRVVL